MSMYLCVDHEYLIGYIIS